MKLSEAEIEELRSSGVLREYESLKVVASILGETFDQLQPETDEGKRIKALFESVVGEFYDGPELNFRRKAYELVECDLRQLAGDDPVHLNIYPGVPCGVRVSMHKTQSVEWAGNLLEGVDRIRARVAPAAAQCDHDWQDIGGAASGDAVEVFQCCTKCGYEQEIETPREDGGGHG